MVDNMTKEIILEVFRSPGHRFYRIVKPNELKIDRYLLYRGRLVPVKAISTKEVLKNKKRYFFG